MTEQHRFVSGSQFADVMISAGLISADDGVRRVVIDAQAGYAVKVYVEYFADQRWLDVIPALDGIEIRGDPGGENMSGKHRREPAPAEPTAAQSSSAGQPEKGSVSTETRGGDRVDWAHAEPGHPLPSLPPEKGALEPETAYEPGEAQ